MKPAISLLLLSALVMVGCQKAEPDAKRLSFKSAEFPMLEVIVLRLQRVKFADPPTPDDAQLIQEVTEGFFEYGDRDTPEHKILAQDGTPLLLPLFDQLLPLADDFEYRFAIDRLLEVFVLYQTPETLDRVVQAAHAGVRLETWNDRFWEIAPGTPNYEAFWKTMVDNPPHDEDIFRELLAVANNFSIDEEISQKVHPYDTPHGIEQIRDALQISQGAPTGKMLSAWMIEGEDPAVETARVATESLPFLQSPVRDQLLKLAVEHPSPVVQLESAWARAKLGQQEGVDELVRQTRDLRFSLTAQSYLEDVGKAELIPADVATEEFQIRSFCTNSLASYLSDSATIQSMEILQQRVVLWPLQPMKIALVSFQIEFEKEGEKQVVEDVGHYNGSDFFPSTSAVTVLSSNSFGDQLAGYKPSEIYGALVVNLLARTQILGAGKALTEEYAQGEDQIRGLERLRSRLGKRVGRASIDTKLAGYPTAKAVIFESTKKGQDGWTVLEQGEETFYPKSDYPETADAQRILRMHVGRRYLGLPSE